MSTFSKYAYRRLNEIFLNILLTKPVLEPYLEPSSRDTLRRIHTNMHQPNIQNPTCLVTRKELNRNALIVPDTFRSSIPNNILVDVENEPGTFTSYEILMFEKTKVQLFVFIPSQVDMNANDCVRRIVQYLTFILPLSYANGTHVSSLTCYLYLTNHKKILPSSPRPLGPKEINSAVTAPSGPTIVVFRKEEFFKVFIHELFHALGFDFSNMSPTNITRIDNQTGVSAIVPNEHKTYETYCETFAVLIHTLFVNATFEKAMDLLLHEQFFSALQCAKVLPFVDNRFTHKTSVGAYHVLKFALLLNLNAFIDMQVNTVMGKDVDADVRFFQIKPRDVEAFEKLIVNSWRRLEVQEWLTTAAHFLRTPTITDKDYILKKTLRMSAF